MKIRIVRTQEPKTKKAALNLVAYSLQQIEICKQRKENLAMNKSNAEEKILRLQNTLVDIQNQIESLNTTQKDWEDQVRKLETQFQLTESEILETKSALLRQQINNLQKLAGIEDTGKATLE